MSLVSCRTHSQVTGQKNDSIGVECTVDLMGKRLKAVGANKAHTYDYYLLLLLAAVTVIALVAITSSFISVTATMTNHYPNIKITGPSSTQFCNLFQAVVT